MKPPIKYFACDQCSRLMPEGATSCIHCGTVVTRALLALAHPDNPPLTCAQLLEHARDSMDAADAELQAANKLASGLASLLLLDMIRETHVMACRIRAIIAASMGEQP